MQPNITVRPQVPQVPTQVPQQTQSTQETVQASSVEVENERHTRFLSTMIGKDKAFRIPCTIQKPDGTKVAMDKTYVQADQGSDMNVVSTAMARDLGLECFSLADIGFSDTLLRRIRRTVIAEDIAMTLA